MPRREAGEPPSDPEASEASSGRSSRASRAQVPFIGNAGPAFDPETAAQQQEATVTQLELVDVVWQSDRIRTILKGQGVVVHGLIGVAEDDWLWRRDELDAIDEPLANVLNKFPITRAAAAVSDELAVMTVLGGYVHRSIRDRAQYIRAQRAVAEQRGPEPITGYAPAPTAQPVTQAGAPAEPMMPPGAPAPIPADSVPWRVPE